MKTKLFSLLLLVAGISGCKKETVQDAAPQRNDTDYYVALEINGEKKEYVARSDFGYRMELSSGSSSGGGGDTTLRNAGCGFLAYELPSGKEQLYIYLHVADAPNDNLTTMSAHLNAGNLPLYKLSDLYLPQSIEITYRDASRKEWYSSFTGNQTGSASLISIAPGTYLGFDALNIRVTFNCKLFDGLGSELTITNGEAFVKIIEDFD